MALKVYKPTSAGRRGMTGYSFKEITKSTPEKALLIPRKQNAGRNNDGKITVRHRGGGAKRAIRVVDYRREKFGVPARIAAIEYDPNRTARIALCFYADGDKRYIIAPVGLNVGDIIMSGSNAELKTGNALPLGSMPSGVYVHNIEIVPGKGGQMVRGAGMAAQLMDKEGGYALLRLPSGEMRRVPAACMATMGQVGNIEHQGINLGKAGRSRWLGRRPQVRGTAMNPNDHPHGGGEGRSPVGLAGPKTPWGKPALGYKTRKPKASDKLIVKRRR